MSDYTDTLSTLKIGYSSEQQVAFDRGKDAFADGHKRNQNPFWTATYRNAWFDGYDLARAAASVAKGCSA